MQVPNSFRVVCAFDKPTMSALLIPNYFLQNPSVSSHCKLQSNANLGPFPLLKKRTAKKCVKPKPLRCLLQISMNDLCIAKILDLGSSCKVNCSRCIKYWVYNRCLLSMSVSDVFRFSPQQRPTSCSCYLSSLPPPWFVTSSAWWNFSNLVEIDLISSRHGLEMSWAPVNADSLAKCSSHPTLRINAQSSPCDLIQNGQKTLQFSKLIEHQQAQTDVEKLLHPKMMIAWSLHQCEINMSSSSPANTCQANPWAKVQGEVMKLLTAHCHLGLFTHLKVDSNLHQCWKAHIA